MTPPARQFMSPQQLLNVADSLRTNPNPTIAKLLIHIALLERVVSDQAGLLGDRERTWRP